jgi:hypothetical protein
MSLDRERVKRLFPNLAKELERSENRVPVNSIRTDFPTGEKAVAENFCHYIPDIVDFIRRCDTEQQAIEIIGYMEKRGEVDKEYACRLRQQLKEKGVRSFGSKKETDYYLKHGEL